MESIERRLAALERQAEEQEDKRQALRDEIIALQVLVTTALPIISTSAGAQLCVALDAAIIRASAVLKAADYAPDEIAGIVGILAAWREDMGESAGAAGASTCH